MTKKKKIILLSLSFLLLATVLTSGLWAYRIVYASNFEVVDDAYILIEEQDDFDTVLSSILENSNCKHPEDFKLLAEAMQYPENIKTGKYKMKNGDTNLQLLRMLSRGLQTAVKITFNNARTTGDMAKKLTANLMTDSAEVTTLLNNLDFCSSLGFNNETIKAMFIPNTYEVYWNISAEKLLNRMHSEYNKFWNEKRTQQAKNIGMTPLEVAILASIVEEETAALDEYPIVAGLYINRLANNIPLQADPTVKYALGDITLQRILYKHLEIDSPYNTYIHTGLPPAPLRIPSIQGLNAVLNHAKHSYFYMCAKEDLSGRHNFSRTLAEHNRHADRYRAELNRRGIR